jgi:hypothetical protein
MSSTNNAYPKMAKMRKDPKSLQDALNSAEFIEATRRVERKEVKRAERKRSQRPATPAQLDKMKETIQVFSGKSQYNLDESHRWSGEKIKAYLMLLCVKYGIDTDLGKSTKSVSFAVKQSRDFVDAMAQHFNLSRKETLLAIEQWFVSWENFCETMPKAKEVGFYPGYWVKAFGTLGKHYPFNVLRQAEANPIGGEARLSTDLDSMKLSNLFKPKDSEDKKI